MVKKVNIGLRKEVHSQAKIISILKNIPLNKYLESCIEKVLQEDEALLHAFTLQKKNENQGKNKDISKQKIVRDNEDKMQFDISLEADS